MALKKITLLLATFLMGFIHANAQVFYNSGSSVVVTGGGILYVSGAAENTLGGSFSNAGQTTVVGYFKNGGFATGGNAAGLYNIYGDWINNNTFTANQSDVEMLGDTQQITGSSVTTFYTLGLQTAGALKTQTLNANVTNLLALNDCRLATNDFDMTVLNPSAAAITRDSGYVSSTTTGRLVRATNSTGTYLFPTGWNDGGTVDYRPVEMTPSVPDSQLFAVRMAFGDPATESYPTTTSATGLAVNNKFFHHIKQLVSTAPADLSIYFDPNTDGQWNSIGRWQTVPQWQDIGPAQQSAGSPLSKVTRFGWIDNANEPHALINLNSAFYFPNVFAPNGTYPDNIFTMFSQDSLATLESLRIFDRWGEQVYGCDGNCDAPGTGGWDGKYKGKMQVMGNYVYSAGVKLRESGEIKNVSGNLTLLW